jgi:mannonate dehydratase
MKITNVKTIITAPAKLNLVVVKIETSEPGLYGLGCATFAWRSLAVQTVLDSYLKPFLMGRDPQRIEDIWQQSAVSGYWRNGPELNNALSGVDMALWDIKGKQSGLPVYQLWGGKCREGVLVYRHTAGKTPEEVEAKVRQYMEQGVMHVRCQIGGYGGGKSPLIAPKGALPGQYYDPAAYARTTVALFEHLRKKLGNEVELLHDVHERLAPADVVRLAKQLEPYRLFFLEDALAPEQVEWFRTIRQHYAGPLAMGELFNNPLEWEMLIKERLIDFIRVHVSQIGGVTPALKLARFCEQFGVRTAWHGPGDVSPVGHAANIHLDLAVPNFGIQEWGGFSETLQEVFPGCPEQKGGYVYINDKPGWGIDLDEKKAARFPGIHEVPTWTQTRLPDGTSAKP